MYLICHSIHLGCVCSHTNVFALQADPLGDLSTELERELGKLVKAKYHTDFYMLYNYPLAVCTASHLHHTFTCL